MDGPSRGPALLSCPLPSGLPQGSLGSRLRERSAVSGRRQCPRGPRGAAPPRAAPPPHSPHRSRLRGVCSAEPTAGAPPGAVHPAGTSLDDLASGAGLLRLGKKSAGDSARSRSGRGGLGEPKRGPAAVGALSPPAPRSAAGQLCLRRRAMCCVSISPCPAAKPPGAAALNPLRAAIPAPSRALGGAPAAAARTALRGGQSALPHFSRSRQPLASTTGRGPGAGAAAPCALRAL